MKNQTKILSFLYLLACIALWLAAATACRTVKLLPGETIIKDSIVYKDTPVYVKVPPITIKGDTVTLTDTVPCPDAKWEALSTSKNGRTHIKAEISKGRIKIDCKTDSLVHEVDSLKAVIKVKESYQRKSETRYLQVKDWYIPWWFWIIAAVTVLLIILLIKKLL